MRLLTAPEVESFFDRVRGADTAVLFLDYDGTLAPFSEQRQESPPDPAVLRLVRAILELPSSRVVLVSGRGARTLAALLGAGRRPEIWGSHGLERLRPNGAYESAVLPAEARRLLLEEEAWWERRGWRRRLDVKPLGIVLDGRGLPAESARGMRQDARTRWRPFARLGLVVQESEHGIELRLGGRDKGTAVRTVLSEVGDRAVAAYLGDDWADEEGFRAIQGRGIGALVRESPRVTAADLWLRPPGDLLEFLRRWRDGAGAQAAASWA